MKNYIFIFTAVFILTGFKPDATRSISGTVYNGNTKMGLAFATVTVLGASAHTATDFAGHYVIMLPNGHTQLVFAAMGFKNDTLTVSKSNMLNVFLRQLPVYKTDTVLYQARAYKNKGSKTTDELLKTMQGIEVGADGAITHQGQQVVKIRINGKDFYGSDAQQAVQNLPADIVQKIQVVDDYGDQAAKTGIKSGDPNKVLNITTSTDSKAKAYPPGVYDKSVTINQNKQVTRSTGLARANAPLAEVVVNKPMAPQTLIGRSSYPSPPDNESYARITENHFEDPKTTPLSTFAVDVDAASYSNVRRFINNGQLPPKNAVRIEEMINYFHYDLPAPTDGQPVAIHTELSVAPWNPQHQLVRIGLKAKEVKLNRLPPSNLVFLLDVSGSMGEPNKLPLVKTSMKMLVDQLRPIDHVAIVVYAGEAGVKLESTAGSDKQKIKDAIDLLSAGGSTAGGEGIKLAYQIAVQKFIKGGNNRIILATDGDFNVGASSDKDMEALIEEERGSGVSISILGFGMGNLKDSKMERMADKGHGNYAYIDNITEATKSMVSEFGGTLFTVAKDVKLQVEFNPGKVQAYRLLGYEDRLMQKEDFNNDSKTAGDMGVGHTVTALYEIIPVGVKDSFSASVDPLKYQKPVQDKVANMSDEVMTIKFRYKQPDADVSKMEAVTVADKPIAAAKTSDDFRFAASVAEFGMLLRDSQFKQGAKYDQLIAMAKSAKGKDDDGYRAEFIRLVESTRNMSPTHGANPL